MESFVTLKNVTKSYKLGQTTVKALRGLDLELKRGEFTAIVGASGSGKSTLLNLIGCIDLPDDGEVIVEGAKLAKLSEDDRAALRNQKIGYIFQSFNLVPVLTVYENVELPMTINPNIPAAERKARVLRALEDVGLSSFAQHLPDKLSGGQRQRVAIARALVNEPSLIMADEPTASLDSETTHKIIDLLLELNQKRQVTFLFSTHDEKLMSRVSRVVLLKDGVIVS